MWDELGIYQIGNHGGPKFSEDGLQVFSGKNLPWQTDATWKSPSGAAKGPAGSTRGVPQRPDFASPGFNLVGGEERGVFLTIQLPLAGPNPGMQQLAAQRVAPPYIWRARLLGFKAPCRWWLGNTRSSEAGRGDTDLLLGRKLPRMEAGRAGRSEGRAAGLTCRSL